MPDRYVEVNDEGTALSGASQLASLGARLDDKSLPPSVEWGDDRFGAAMLEEYHKPADGAPEGIPVSAMAEKPELSRLLTELGDGTTQAVTLATNQELLNILDIDRVQPPAV